MRPFGLAAVVLAIAAAASAAAPGALSRSQVEKQAIAIYNKATRVVSHTRTCRPPRPSPPTFTHAPPSADLLATLGILRRPATPEDVVPQGQLLLPFTRNIYEDYVRVAHAADGRSYYVVAAQDALAFPAQSPACMRRLRRTLLRLLRGKPPRVRKRALHFFDGAVRENRRLAHRQPREGVFLFERRADGLGSGGGGSTVSQIRETGMWGSIGTRSKDRAHVTGLIPDGVATVTSTFSRVHSHGPHLPPKVYPKVIIRTDRAVDNVVSFSVARDAEDAFPSKMVWRAADGSIVRVVRY